MATLQEKRQKRGKLVADARKISETAEKEKRELTKEEIERFDKLMDEERSLKDEIDQEEGRESRKRWLEEAERELEESRGSRPDPEDPSGRGRRGSGREEVRETRWKVRSGEERCIRHEGTRGSEEYREAYRMWLRSGSHARVHRIMDNPESRALQADVDIEGGYLVTPTQMLAGILQNVDDRLFIRQHATVHLVPNAQSLGQVSLDADLDDGEWTSELETGSDDESMRFGKRSLTPHPLAKRIKISEKLVRMSPSIEGYVNQRMSYKFALTEEKAYLTGNGNQKPLGVFVVHDDGIPASRDVQTGSATGFTADGLIDARYSLKEQYIPKARWCFHREGIKRIAKLKDGDGQYLWRPGLVEGQPDKILNIPLDSSENCPSTFTSGQYVGGLFCWEYYYIAQALNLQMKRLNELYAETNQIGFIGRMEIDGMPALAEAFTRLKTN